MPVLAAAAADGLQSQHSTAVGAMLYALSACRDASGCLICCMLLSDCWQPGNQSEGRSLSPGRRRSGWSQSDLHSAASWPGAGPGRHGRRPWCWRSAPSQHAPAPALQNRGAERRQVGGGGSGEWAILQARGDTGIAMLVSPSAHCGARGRQRQHLASPDLRTPRRGALLPARGAERPGRQPCTRDRSASGLHCAVCFCGATLPPASRLWASLACSSTLQCPGDLSERYKAKIREPARWAAALPAGGGRAALAGIGQANEGAAADQTRTDGQLQVTVRGE